MADSRHNTVAERLKQATVEATAQATAIEHAASVVAHLMQQAHGGEWRTKVDHPSQYVMIFAAGDRTAVAPKRGELV